MKLISASMLTEPDLEKRDIELAERRMEDWMRRFPKGDKLPRREQRGIRKASVDDPRVTFRKQFPVA